VSPDELLALRPGDRVRNARTGELLVVAAVEGGRVFAAPPVELRDPAEWRPVEADAGLDARVAALEADAHPPQEIRPRVIAALLEFGLLAPDDPRIAAPAAL
jgi:hypothetical protein